ncbi:MAG: cupin domain-containing protein [Parvularculaceae bacterium]|jgi:quercetin dioxygenase-like cupin family protein|nr:cupin domain-containing protein [Parvularculaceae bacterium]
MMWGQSGGRSLITGNSIGAWVLRVLIFAFMTGGALAIIVLATRFLGAALAQGEPPLLSGALIMQQSENLPHAFEAGWKGRKVCELLEETEEMRAARCTFPPGVGHEKHWHGPHFGYIVEGSRMRTTDAAGTVERDLKSGASWKSDGNVHEALNVGERTAVYIIVEFKKQD